MDHWACISFPALPLQILLNRNPNWKTLPTAVVVDTTPHATILWVNRLAARSGVERGMRYAGGLSLEPRLRAGSVSASDIAQATDRLTTLLLDFTPDVEPHPTEPGVFWLNTAGLTALYHTPLLWGRRLTAALRDRQFVSSLAIGYTRFGTYALARSSRGIRHFSTPRQERTALMEVALQHLDLDRDVFSQLRMLAIATLGELLTLPGDGLFERFGQAIYDLHTAASKTPWQPLQPNRPVDPLHVTDLLDYPETDISRLLFLIKRALDSLLTRLFPRKEAIEECCLTLRLVSKTSHTETLRPARPTLDERQLLELIRLRLESTPFASGVVALTLAVTAVPATDEQLRLFQEHSHRHADGANRALARLIAMFGEDAVVQPCLRDGHLPEAQFTWKPLDHLRAAAPRNVYLTPLIRRIRFRATPFPGQRLRFQGSDCFVTGMEYGPARRVVGPYIVSGGWWNREVERKYYFVEAERGEILWLYHDRHRRRWFLHGSVE